VSRVAQSLQCLATGWTTGRSRFDPRQGRKDFSSSLCVQICSGVHPASCTMGIGGHLPVAKHSRGVTLITHSHLVSRSRMSRSYTFSPPSVTMACSGTALLAFSSLKVFRVRSVSSCCSLLQTLLALTAHRRR
jgi:hypothetical protein